MKRFGTVLLCALLLLLCACAEKVSGVEETAVFVDPNAVKAGAYGSLSFAANGYSFGIYDPMEDVLQHIPSNATFTGESCAFDGDDLTYFFNGFEVMANVLDGAERVTAIKLVDDTVRTPDGLYIGMSEEELTEILSVPADVGGIYTERDGTAQRNVTVQDSTVREITYIPAN